jgi:hypothetical protein
MSQTEPTRQSDEILPPIVGSILVLPLTASVLIVDLTSLAQSAALPSSTVKGSENINPLGQYLTFIGDGSWNCAFAGTAAALLGLSTSATSTVSQSAGSTQYQIPGGNTANGTILIPGGTPLHLRMPPGPTADTLANAGTIAHGSKSNARFLGALASSNTNLRIWVSSR